MDEGYIEVEGGKMSGSGINKDRILAFFDGLSIPEHLECRVRDGCITFEREWSDVYKGMLNRVMCGHMKYEVVDGDIGKFREGLKWYMNEVDK